MVAADGVEYAVDSCRTQLYDGTVSRVDDNVPDNAKLSVRGDYKAAKSWIKFDISGLDPASMTSCRVRITLAGPKTGTCSLSAVNDDCLDNIDWTESTLTWNNAPGNITSSDGVNPNDSGLTTDNLQEDLVATKATLIETVDYSAGGVAGQQFTYDVLSILQADTDGIVQFVLHDSSGETIFADA